MIRVLIVEDEALIADAHQTYLERLEGFTVAAVAHTARDAMRAAADAAANDAPIDLVLLDIGLPDANGIALASGMSNLRPVPDIIAITSERDLEMVRAAVGHGALAYLLKPFTFAAFRDRLERYRRYREALPAGIDAATLGELEQYGLVVPIAGGGYYDSDALLVARTVGLLAAHGVQARHLRAARAAADREAGLIEAAVAPLRASRDDDAEGRAAETVDELATLLVRMHAALLRARLAAGRSG